MAAGEWIKVTTNLPEKPEVWAIAKALNIENDAAIGKLIRVWIWFDQNTENGNAPSVTELIIDHITGVAGFAAEMERAGWLVKRYTKLFLPNFENHNGKTAKKRANTLKRVETYRNAVGVTKALPEKKRNKKEKESASALYKENSHDAQTGETFSLITEQTQDDGTAQQSITGRPANARARQPPVEHPGFEEFYSAYPRKASRRDAAKAWQQIKPDLAELIADISARLAVGHWTNDSKEFIPYPASYLRAGGWNDDLIPRKASNGNGKPNQREGSSERAIREAREFIAGIPR